MEEQPSPAWTFLSVDSVVHDAQSDSKAFFFPHLLLYCGGIFYHTLKLTITFTFKKRNSLAIVHLVLN